MTDSSLTDGIEAQDWIDTAAVPVSQTVERALDRHPLVAGALHGAWMGHPLHAAMTDIPVGAWTAGVVLDLLDVAGGQRRLRAGADAVYAIGLAGAFGAAVTGIADWSRTRGGARRVGFAHGASNVVVTVLMGASLLARARGARKTGVALAAAGWSLTLFNSWLGGHLGYRYGVGVDRRALAASDRADHAPSRIAPHPTPAP